METAGKGYDVTGVERKGTRRDEHVDDRSVLTSLTPSLSSHHIPFLSLPVGDRGPGPKGTAPSRLRRGPPGGMERVNREDDKPSGNPSQTVPEGAKTLSLLMNGGDKTE